MERLVKPSLPRPLVRIGAGSTGELSYNHEAHDVTNYSRLQSITLGTNQRIDANGQVYFQDWTQNDAAGEPRGVTMEFNQTVSHATVENPGFGYSLPAEVYLVGGQMHAEQLNQYVERNQTGSSGMHHPIPPLFKEAEFSLNSDANGSITELNVTHS